MTEEKAYALFEEWRRRQQAQAQAQTETNEIPEIPVPKDIRRLARELETRPNSEFLTPPSNALEAYESAGGGIFGMKAFDRAKKRELRE